MKLQDLTDYAMSRLIDHAVRQCLDNDITAAEEYMKNAYTGQLNVDDTAKIFFGGSEWEYRVVVASEDGLKLERIV